MYAQPSPQPAHLQKSPAPFSTHPPLLWSAFCLHSTRRSRTSPVDTVRPDRVPWGWLRSLSSTWPGSTRGAAGVGTSPFVLCGWTAFSLFTRRWSFVWFALWGYCKGCLCKHCFNRSFNVDVCVGASLLLGILICWGYLPLEAEHLESRGPWTRALPWRWGSDLVISVSPAPTEAQPRDRTNGDFWNICSLLAPPPAPPTLATKDQIAFTPRSLKAPEAQRGGVTPPKSHSK